jgi:autotransporter-associated beta strand protein
MKHNSSLHSNAVIVHQDRLTPHRFRLRLLAPLAAAASLYLGFSASAATALWNWTSGDRNWSTSGNWSGVVPAGANDVIFGPIDAQTAATPVNTVDGSVTVKSLAFTNSAAGAYTSYQNTTVAAGQTLAITNGLFAGVGNSVGYAANPYTYANVTGAGGTVLVTGGNVQVGYQSSSSASTTVSALLDMRGLDNFIYANTVGTFGVAASGQRRSGGELYLAGTNNITASAISLGVGVSGSGSSAGSLHLGATNTLFADTITLAKLVAGGVIDFQTGLNNPVAKIRAKDGVSGVANWYVGWNSTGGTSSTGVGTNDFSGGILDAAVTNLYLGYFNSGGSGSRVAGGSFTIGTNASSSLVVQNLYVGAMASASSVATFSTVGNFNVLGGTVTAGAVTLAQQLGLGAATGNLRLNDCLMQVSGDLASGGTSSISVSNATLNVAGRIGSPTTIVATMNLSSATLGLTLIAPGNYLQAAASAGALNIDGASGSTVIKINNASPAPGQYPLIAYTSLGGATGFDGLRVQAPAGTTATLVNNTAGYPSTVDVVITASQLTWDGAPNGNWAIGGTANWKSGATSVTYTETAGVGNRVLFSDAASGTTTVNLTTTLSPLGITVSNTNKDYTFSGSGKLSGTGGLIKQGSGTLTLAQTGVNDFSGNLFIGSGGKLRVGSGGTAGNIGSGSVAVDGTLEFNRSDDLTLTNAISGAGGLTKLGANTLTLAGAANYVGTTTISGGALVVSPAATETLAGDITGSGRLMVNGAGTLILTGTGNNYSGGTLVASGTLQIGDGSNAGSLPGNVTNQTALVFNGGGYTLANAISGAGSVFSIGASCSLTLAGANTYTGPTIIKNSGTLYLGASGAMSPQSILVLGDTGGTTIGAADFTGYNAVVGGLTIGGNQVAANTLTLGSGKSLTVNGNMNIGSASGGGAKPNLTVTGAGASLAVNTNGGLIQLGLSTGGAGVAANNINCDLTGLDVFTANLGTGSLRLGEVNLATGSGTSLQVLRLAATNTITAGTVSVGSGGKSLVAELHLGGGTNVLNTDIIKVGAGDSRDSGKVIFEGGSGSVRIRGSGGASTRANLNILVGNAGTGGGSTNTFDLTGHYADLLLDTLVVGDQASRSGPWSSYFAFDQGVLDASSVSLAKAGHTTGAAWMHLGGGTATFGSLALASGSAAATLEITGGQVTVNSGIAKTGAGDGTIQVANASLLVKGGIATPALPISTITLDGATLSVGRTLGYGNPTSALVSVGSLSLSGTCKLALTGANYVVGQFPLISYVGSIGGSGFAAISTFTPPPGVTATLVDNSASQTIDVHITAAPPATRASLGFATAPGSVGLAWQDLGMILQTNAVGVTSPADWFTYPGSTSVTNVTVTVDPAGPNVFFRLVYP